jgi:ornithine carbamoyltransferase
MDLNQKVTFADTVFAQEVDGEMVLLDMNSENYFGLDAVGTDIWQAMQVIGTLQDVLETLLVQYEVEEDVLRKDLLAFVEKLQESGLVQVEVL